MKFLMTADGEHAADTRRSNRRHHLKRMKRKAEHIGAAEAAYTHRFYHCVPDDATTEAKRRRVKSANHLKICSCWMCGNPRRQKFKKSSRLTMQEKRAVKA